MLLAVVGALVLMLFPALQNARHEVQVAGCTRNLRKLGQAFRMYAEDYGHYADPVQLVHSVKDKRMLLCPEDDQKYQAHASYSFRTLLPPDLRPYWARADLSPSTVVAVCGHHLWVDTAARHSDHAPVGIRYPYKLVLRAGGNVEPIPLSHIQEIAIPGPRPRFAHVYPGELGYREAAR